MQINVGQCSALTMEPANVRCQWPLRFELFAASLAWDHVLYLRMSVGKWVSAKIQAENENISIFERKNGSGLTLTPYGVVSLQSK